MSASVFTSAEGSVAELTLVFAFWGQGCLPRRRSRGCGRREDCNAGAGHVECLVSCIRRTDKTARDCGSKRDTEEDALGRMTGRVASGWTLSLSLPLTPRSHTLPWGLKCECGEDGREVCHWKRLYPGHGRSVYISVGGSRESGRSRKVEFRFEAAADNRKAFLMADDANG